MYQSSYAQSFTSRVRVYKLRQQTTFSRSNSFKISRVIGQAVIYTKIRNSGYVILKLMYNKVECTLSQISQPRSLFMCQVSFRRPVLLHLVSGTRLIRGQVWYIFDKIFDLTAGMYFYFYNVFRTRYQVSHAQRAMIPGTW